jgi:hypothetical protein
MTIPPEQNGEIIEPGNNSLKFDAIHEENRDRSLAFSNVVQEHILHVLGLLGCHGTVLLFVGGCARRHTETGLPR